MAINNFLRQRVRKRAKSLCEYCHSPERISGSRFTLDHVYPRSLGGSDDFENLALACSRCNQRRYNFITGRDAETASISPLFNPRVDEWKEHFAWAEDGRRVVGTT
ncbi:MAG: HNH endonuclease signature motif containing protein, partial [Phormidesmis sp.]